MKNKSPDYRVNIFFNISQKMRDYNCDAPYWIQIIGLQNTYKDIKWVEVNLPMAINNPAKAETLFPEGACSWYSVPKTSILFKIHLLQMNLLVLSNSTKIPF